MNRRRFLALFALTPGLAAAPGTIPEQPIDIIADRPFYLVIGDVATGTPLFLSRISDPAA